MKRTHTTHEVRAANESILPVDREGEAGPSGPTQAASPARTLEDWELILVGGGDTVTCW
jgi:hypothetical protein